MSVNLLTGFGQYLTQNLSGRKSFRVIAKLINNHCSPKKDVAINLGKFTLYANSLDRLLALYLLKHSALEYPETELVKKIVKRNMIVADVGANLGYYSLIFAEMVGQKGLVYAFEPNQSIYRLLKKNIRTNHFKNIMAINQAVADKNGKADLYICEEHRGNHCIYDPGDKRETIEVKTVKLDSFFYGKTSPDIIKLDIEGAEYLALQGMKTIMKKKNLKIICEFSPSLLKKCHSSPKQLFDLISQLGYKIKLITKDQSLVETHFNDLIKIYSGNKYTNLLLEK